METDATTHGIGRRGGIFRYPRACEQENCWPLGTRSFLLQFLELEIVGQASNRLRPSLMHSSCMMSTSYITISFCINRPYFPKTEKRKGLIFLSRILLFSSFSFHLIFGSRPSSSSSDSNSEMWGECAQTVTEQQQQQQQQHGRRPLFG